MTNDRNYTFICKNEEQIKAYVNPTRMRILKWLSAKKLRITDLALKLDVHPANLTHHVKILEKAGLVKLVEKRDTGRNLEKYYQAVASHYMVQSGIDGDLNAQALALSILHNDLESAVFRAYENPNQETLALLGSLCLQAHDFHLLQKELKGLFERYKARNKPDGKSFHLNIALYPGVNDHSDDTEIFFD